MKNEKIFFELPVIPCPDIKMQSPPNKYYKNYIYAAELFNKQVLILTVFEGKKHRSVYRCFVGPSDYVSQKRDEKTWCRSTAKPHYAFNRWETSFATDNKSEMVIENFAKKNGIEFKNDGFSTIAYFLDDLGRRKADERFKKIQAASDRIMLKIRPLPKDFNKWLSDIPFKNDRYIMYRYTGKKVQDGYCTHCNNHISVEGARNWQQGKCPNCKSKVTFIAEGKLSRDKLRKTQSVCYVQICSDDYIIRNFSVTRYFDYSRDSFTLIHHEYIHEISRHFGVAKKSYIETDSIRGTYFKEYYYGYGNSSGWVYAKNLKKLAERSKAEHMKYVPWKKLFTSKRYQFTDAWETIENLPVLESLIKRGMTNYVSEIISEYSGGWKKTGVKDLLSIPKATQKILEKYNMKLSEMPTYTACLAKNKDYVKEILEWTRREYYRTDEVLKAIQFNSYPVLVEYLKSQANDQRWDYGTVSDYADYIGQCEELHLDMRDTKVIRPKNLRERHEWATEQLKLQRKQINERGVKEAYYKNVFSLAFTDGEYSVILPRNSADLKYEGDKLRHCVYTNYTSNVASGECVIVFVRRNNKFYEPLATAEINPEDYHVVQFRGLKNTAPSEDVQKFWEKYKKYLEKAKRRNLKEVA